MLEPRPGGAYEFRFGERTGHGEVPFFAPEDRLSLTWRLDARNGTDLGAWTLVVFSLRPAPGGTRLTVAHSGFGVGGAWDSAYDAYVGWWHFFLGNLKSWVEDGVDRRAAFFGHGARAADGERGRAS